MEKKRKLLSPGLSVALAVIWLAFAFNIATAGVEPSPFQPEINQLGAVANILHSADFRVANSIAVPPEPCAPPDPCNNPDLNGAVNRVEAIGNQVSSADDMVKAMIEEVMGFEPMPFRAEDLIPPLEVVRDAAGGMVARVGIFLRTSPDSAPEYIEALETVGNKASDIIDTAQDGIEYLGGAMECSAYETADACNAMPGCVWIIDAAVEFCHIDEY